MSLFPIFKFLYIYKGKKNICVVSRTLWGGTMSLTTHPGTRDMLCIQSGASVMSQDAAVLNTVETPLIHYALDFELNFSLHLLKIVFFFYCQICHDPHIP